MEKEAKRLRELFKGRYTQEEAEQLIAHYGEEAASRILEAEPGEVNRILGKDEEDVLRLSREESERVYHLLEEGLEADSEPHQFACRDCVRCWWRIVPGRKKISKCRRCDVEYEPIPKDKEWGNGEFQCHNIHCLYTFRAAAIMGVTECVCHLCNHTVRVKRIIPPTYRRGDAPRIDTHDCNGINCYRQYVEPPMCQACPNAMHEIAARIGRFPVIFNGNYNRGLHHGNNRGRQHGNNRGHPHGNNRGHLHGNNRGQPHGNFVHFHGNNDGHAYGNNRGHPHRNNRGHRNGDDNDCVERSFRGPDNPGDGPAGSCVIMSSSQQQCPPLDRASDLKLMPSAVESDQSSSLDILILNRPANSTLKDEAEIIKTMKCVVLVSEEDNADTNVSLPQAKPQAKENSSLMLLQDEIFTSDLSLSLQDEASTSESFQDETFTSDLSQSEPSGKRCMKKKKTRVKRMKRKKKQQEKTTLEQEITSLKLRVDQYQQPKRTGQDVDPFPEDEPKDPDPEEEPKDQEDREESPLCYHKFSVPLLPLNAVVRTWSEPHHSSGSTVSTFLDQASLMTKSIRLAFKMPSDG